MRGDLSEYPLPLGPGENLFTLASGVIYSPRQQYRLSNNNAASGGTLTAAGYPAGGWLVKAGVAASEPWRVPKNGWSLLRFQGACQHSRARSQQERVIR